MTKQSALYRKSYGAWAGDPEGRKPDYSLCCEDVADYSSRWPRHHQCSRKRGHGPDGAFCKQHDPDVAKARKAAADARSTAKWNERRYEFSGRQFFATLVRIAEGHNDARGLAQEVVDNFKKGEWR